MSGAIVRDEGVLVSPAPAGRLFGDDAQVAAEPLALELPPKRRAVLLARGPLLLQQGRWSSSELSRMRKTSERWPRSTRRTSPRLMASPGHDLLGRDALCSSRIAKSVPAADSPHIGAARRR